VVLVILLGRIVGVGLGMGFAAMVPETMSEVDRTLLFALASYGYVA
jgi:hypothetical protein